MEDLDSRGVIKLDFEGKSVDLDVFSCDRGDGFYFLVNVRRDCVKKVDQVLQSGGVGALGVDCAKFDDSGDDFPGGNVTRTRVVVESEDKKVLFDEVVDIGSKRILNSAHIKNIARAIMGQIMGVFDSNPSLEGVNVFLNEDGESRDDDDDDVVVEEEDFW